MATKDSRDLTFAERFDLVEAEHRRKLEWERTNNDRMIAVERERTRQKRIAAIQGSLAWVFGVLTVLAVLSAIVWLIWLRPSTGPSKAELEMQYEHQREESCLTRGGGWVPQDFLATTAKGGLCVFPGKVSDG